MHVASSEAHRILTLSILVYAEAEAASHLLALAGLGSRALQRADLEDVGIVPAFAQSGVAEDEPHRLLEGEQSLFVLQDEVVGTLRVLVVRAEAVGDLRLGLLLALDGVTLLVDAEIARMDVVGRISPKIVKVGLLALVVQRGAAQPLFDRPLVLFLEHLAIADGLTVA